MSAPQPPRPARGTRVRVLAWHSAEATHDTAEQRVPVGTAGTVVDYYDTGVIAVQWDNGESSLGLLFGRDRYEEIPLVEATSRSRSIWVRREREGEVGWVGPIRSFARARAERSAWLAAKWAVRLVESTPDVRVQVRLWQARAEQRRRQGTR